MGKGCYWYIAASIVVLAALIIPIIWTSSGPKEPNVSVDGAMISGYNFTADGGLNIAYKLHVTAYSPNMDYSVYYNVVTVSVYHSGTLLAYEVLPGSFTQNPLELEVGLVARSVADGPLSRRGTVEVRVGAVARFMDKGLNVNDHMMEAVCSHVNVRGRTRCDVKLY